MPETPDSEPTSRRFASGKLSLHAAEWGEPGGRPLILVHGGLDHARNWDFVVRTLCAQEGEAARHIVAPDLRGHGDSDWVNDGEYDLAAMVFDLAEIVRALGGGPVDLIGHSLGGNIALRFAAACPEAVRKLVAIEGLGFSPKLMADREAKNPADRLRSWIDDRRRAFERRPKSYPTLEAACARMREQHAFLTEEQAMHLARHGTRRAEDRTLGWKFDPMMRVQGPHDLPAADLHRLWSRVSCPVLLAYGTQSWASNPEQDGRLAHLPNATLTLFEGAGHWLHHQQTGRFTSEAKAFLA